MATIVQPASQEIVLRGLSNPADVKSEMPKLEELLARERAWHSETPRFANSFELFGAVGTKKLVRVSEDANIKPVGRFRNPEWNHRFPPYLVPGALASMQMVGKVWREVADDYGIPAQVRLAATSFTRTKEYQDELIAAGKLAVKDSTHPTGFAYDIDLGGYYIDLSDGTEVVVSLREPGQQTSIARALQEDVSVVYDPIRIGPAFFNPEVPAALLQAAAILHKHEYINAVPEMVGTKNCVLHIAAAPAG